MPVNIFDLNNNPQKIAKKILRQTKWSLFVSFFAGFVALVILIAVFGGGVDLSTTSDCGSDDNSATTTATSKIGKITVKDSSNYYTKIKNIAKAVGPKIGVSPRLLFAQLYQESRPGTQPVNIQDNNYGGMSWTPGCGYPKGTPKGKNGSEGGWYRHYKNISEFASDWAVTVKNKFSKLGNPKDINDYVAKMKKGNYMAGDADTYLAGMKQGWSLWTGKSTLSGAAQVADTAAIDTGEDCDTDDSGSVSGNAIVKEARKWLGWFNYSQQTHTANDNWKHPSKNDTTDCSGFVYFVFKRVGCKVPPSRWATPAMENYAKSNQYLKQIKSSQAGAGDVIIVNVGVGAGNNGHTAILLGKYKGGSTKIIEMGGGPNSCNIKTISYAFGDMVNTGRVTFARTVSTSKIKTSSGASTSSSSSKVVKNLSKAENAARLAIIAPESGGNYKAVNGKYYGAYQLDKSYITSKMYGGDGSLSKANQDYVAYKYMKARYGSWQNALKFRKIKNWW